VSRYRVNDTALDVMMAKQWLDYKQQLDQLGGPPLPWHLIVAGDLKPVFQADVAAMRLALHGTIRPGSRRRSNEG
jgi:hypothetical protein